MVSGIKQIQTNSIDEQSKEIVMNIRYTIGKNEYKRMTTEELRDSFLVRGRTIKFKKIQSPYIYYSFLWCSQAFILTLPKGRMSSSSLSMTWGFLTSVLMAARSKLLTSIR